MFHKKKRRLDAAVNAGSMADIAFLLLIFFLVTTTILNDQGILVMLPPYSNEPIPPKPEDLVLTVKINAANELLVENEPGDLATLRERTKYHIMNPDKKEGLPERPSQAIVSLQNDRSTDYQTYIGVYNELKAAYNELWEEASAKLYGSPYAVLPKAQQKAIRKQIPLVISEAEPTDFAKTR